MSNFRIYILFSLVIAALVAYIAYEKGIFESDSVKYGYQTAYDPLRDAAADLEFAKKQAQNADKKIFMIVGGDWCPWCKAMDKFIGKNPEINKIIEDHFIIFKVYYGSDKPNRDFLAAYPRLEATPQIYILDKNGKLMHTQNTATLEKGYSYDPTKYLAFIKNWAKQKSRS